jgi:hypothetical protein
MNPINKTILIAAGLIAAAIVYHAASQRYDLTPQLQRIDRLTGRVWSCSYSACKEVPEKKTPLKPL